MKKTNKILVFFVLLLFSNCWYFKETRPDVEHSKVHRLAFKDSLNILITKSSVHFNAILLNDSIVFEKDSHLIYESLEPKWLFEETKYKEDYDGKTLYHPRLYEVNPPYLIKKNKDTNFFSVIKDKDTMCFDFYKLDDDNFNFIFK
jgi:hypothetical protein